MISVESKTDLGPVIAKDLHEIYGCPNTIHSSRTCEQTLWSSANTDGEIGTREALGSAKLQNEILEREVGEEEEEQQQQNPISLFYSITMN